jgi:hypothetical protein
MLINSSIGLLYVLAVIGCVRGRCIPVVDIL